YGRWADECPSHICCSLELSEVSRLSVCSWFKRIWKIWCVNDTKRLVFVYIQASCSTNDNDSCICSLNSFNQGMSCIHMSLFFTDRRTKRIHNNVKLSGIIFCQTINVFFNDSYFCMF